MDAWLIDSLLGFAIGLTLGFLGGGGSILTMILLFVVAGLVGVVAGERLARVLNPDQLRTGFALFVALLGLFLLVDNIAKLL